MNLQDIEHNLTEALKARNHLKTSVLRALKTRVMNEKIARGSELSDEDILQLVKSEVKRRKESAEAFASGGRSEMAENELSEISILEQFLPQQASADQIAEFLDNYLQTAEFAKSDFGKVMAVAKAHFGASADGGAISSILKEKLK